MIDQQPLRGVRVLDLTRVLAGPFCTMNLADLGAEVIKIEVPGRGDDSRSFATMMPSGDSGYVSSVNRGKRSITLDLRIEEGAKVFLELAAKSDVVVENFSPGTMDRFKVGYAQLKAANPKIILCSISGFGQTGPKTSAPAYDIVAQALGGTMSITGNPGGEPVRCGVSVGDLSAALYGVIAIMSALRVRDRDGVGNHGDIAILDCQVAMLAETQPRDHWLRLLGDASVPCAPIANVEEVTRDPHLAARNMILHADHPEFDGLIVPGSPLKSAGDKDIPSTRSPRLGESTDEVLRSVLGYDTLRLSELRKRSIM